MSFDLLIKGGEVLDPGTGLDGRLDIGVSGGRIAAIAADLPESGAARCLDARGRIVTPGLVDAHAHVFEHSWIMGEETDRLCAIGGVTTVCDAGSTGSETFNGLKQFVARSVRTRVRAFVNVCAFGIMGGPRGGELLCREFADPEGCAATVRDNPGFALGVKLRFQRGLVWENGPAPLALARQAADLAGAPMMVHVTDSPLPLLEVLDFFKPGDILSHCYHGYEHNIMEPDGKTVRPGILEAQRRGILFDCAHGKGGHFSFPVLERAIDQGFLPDIITTDLTTGSAVNGPVFDLPTTMTKFLHFGVPLREVLLRATAWPARVMGLSETAGALRVGAPADIAVLEMAEGPFPLTDTGGNTVMAKKRLVAAACIRGGEIVHERPV